MVGVVTVLLALCAVATSVVPPTESSSSSSSSSSSTTTAPEKEERGPGFLCAVPKVLRPGESYDVLCSVYNPTTTGTLTLELVSGRKSLASAALKVPKRAVGENQYDATVSLSVPSTAQPGAAVISAKGSGGLKLEQEETVSIEPAVTSMFIQLDKPIHRPGGLVRILVVTLTSDNMPLDGTTDLKISDAAGNLLVKESLESKRGIASFEYQLSSEPLLGVWAVAAAQGNLVGSTTFEVEEYVLPRFEVTLDVPDTLLQSAPVLEGTVKGTYTFGAPVQGKVLLTLYENENVFRPFVMDGPQDDGAITGRVVQKLSLELDAQGMAAFSLDVSKQQPMEEDEEEKEREFDGGFDEPILIGRPMVIGGFPGGFFPPFNFGKELTVEVELTEAATGDSQTATSTVKTAINPIDFKFDDGGRKWFKPGVPFTAVLHATNIDGSPAANQVVEFELFVDSDRSKHRVTTDGLGQAEIIVETKTKTRSFSIQIRSKGNGDLYFSRSPAESPSNSYLALMAPGPGPFEGSDTVEFELVSTERTQPQVSYIVLASGRVVEHGTTADATLSLQVQEDWNPVVTILAYYTRADGEVVTEHARFEVLPTLSTSLEVSYPAGDRTSPGSSVELDINLASAKANEKSSVVVYAVDKSISLLRARSDLSLTGLAAERREKLVPAISENTWGTSAQKAAISNAGFVFLTDQTLPDDSLRKLFRNNDLAFAEDAGAPVARAPAGDAAGGDDFAVVQRTRTFFPETWLWTIHEMTGKKDTLGPFDVPDTISTFNGGAFALSETSGLSVADGFDLTVWQPFFVSLSLPYSLVRGEEMSLRVAVFNHAEQDLEVLLALEDGEYDVLSDKEVTVTVPAGASVGASFSVRPTSLGDVDIEVSARSRLPSPFADAVRRSILVVPEGVTRNYVSNLFVDLTEANSLDEVLDVSLPSAKDIVADSARVAITVTGDLMGPSIKGLDRLVRMPTGCGEQNMITLAPLVSVVAYYKATDQGDPETVTKALGFMKQGLQRQLGYEHPQGGFSAFGKQDPEGSAWLTAFVVKVFSQAAEDVYIDPVVLGRAVRYLLASQQKDGSFPILGRVIHTEMTGGQSGVFTLSCYVTLALVEAMNAASVDVGVDLDDAVARAVSFITRGLEEQTDMYSIVLAAYVLNRAGPQTAAADEAFARLESLATRTEDGLVFWTKTVHDGPEDELPVVPLHARYSSLPAKDVEMTAYALLAHVARGRVADAFPIVKWLSNQRSAFGGFHSTQDTVVGLEALARFASATFSDAGNALLTINVAAGSSFAHTFEVTAKNMAVLQSVTVSPLQPGTGSLQLSAKGRGAAIVQASVTWNELPKEVAPPIVLEVDNTLGSGVSESVSGSNGVVIQACARSAERSATLGMSVISVDLFSGFSADTASLQDLVDSNKNVKRFDIDETTVHLYLDAITGNNVCYKFLATKQFAVKNLQAVKVEVFDYYEPAKSTSQVLQPRAGVEMLRSLDAPADEPMECPKGSHYEACGSACPPTCLEPNPQTCIKVCVPGCVCNKSRLLQADGTCVKKRKCAPRVCKKKRFTHNGERCKCRINGCYRCELWPTGRKRCLKCFTKRFTLDESRGRCKKKPKARQN
eukprot:m.479780 g.479780  ORF g.479780 m.479780 type:complete len:1606 (+) comp21606_c0_seq1:182-4999(+)